MRWIKAVSVAVGVALGLALRSVFSLLVLSIFWGAFIGIEVATKDKLWRWATPAGKSALLTVLILLAWTAVEAFLAYQPGSPLDVLGGLALLAASIPIAETIYNAIPEV